MEARCRSSRRPRQFSRVSRRPDSFTSTTSQPRVGHERTCFETPTRFFRLPMDDKLAYAWTTPEANCGYSAPGREKVTELTNIREVFRSHPGRVWASEPSDHGSITLLFHDNRGGRRCGAPADGLPTRRPSRARASSMPTICLPDGATTPSRWTVHRVVEPYRASGDDMDVPPPTALAPRYSIA